MWLLADWRLFVRVKTILDILRVALLPPRAEEHRDRFAGRVRWRRVVVCVALPRSCGVQVAGVAFQLKGIDVFVRRGSGYGRFFPLWVGNDRIRS